MVLLLLLPAACGSSRPEPPVLQRFARMRQTLTASSSLSARVSEDVRRLRRAEQEGQAATSRGLARTLRKDAGRLARLAGATANRLVVLGRDSSDPRLRIYLDTLALALGAEWHEGRALMRLSRLIERDPYGIVPATASAERALASYAQAASARAVGRIALAERLREQYPLSFRYVPVPTPTPG